jgi:hypothetical protein
MLDTVERFENRAFDQVKHAEEPMLRFAHETSDAVARFVPTRPRFMADMPKFTDVVESQLKFRKRVVDEQLRFARKMMKAMDPLVDKIDAEPEPIPPKAAPVAKKAPRSTTRKAA